MDTQRKSDNVSEANNTRNTSNYYPLIYSKGIDVHGLSDSEVQLLIGELIRFQRSRKTTPVDTAQSNPTDTDELQSTTDNDTQAKKSKKRKKRIPTSFQFTQNEVQYNTVPIPTHKDDKAFNSYIRKKDYPREIINEMGKSRKSKTSPVVCEPEQGARRMITRLAKNHPDVLVMVANEHNLIVNGVLDAVSLAAWIKDTNLKQWQAIKTLKHFRASLGGKIAVPFSKIKQYGPDDPLIQQRIELVHSVGSRGQYKKRSQPGDSDVT